MIQTRNITAENLNYLENLQVKKADYLNNYNIRVFFSDGKTKDVDFSSFILSKANGYLAKYKKPSMFKNFTIEHGNIVWGKDWDLIFPIRQLYKGKVTV